MVDRETEDDVIPDSEISADALISSHREHTRLANVDDAAQDETASPEMAGQATMNDAVNTSHLQDNQTDTATRPSSESVAIKDVNSASFGLNGVEVKSVEIRNALDAAQSMLNHNAATIPSDPNHTKLKGTLAPTDSTLTLPSLPPTTDDGDDQPRLLGMSNAAEENYSGSVKDWFVDGSPHRSNNVSRVSSLGSTVNCLDNATDEAVETVINMNHLTDDVEDDYDNDDEVIPTTTDVVFDPMVLFTDKSPRHNGVVRDNSQSHSLAINSDDKSIRSESTRPDPPSVIDGKNARKDSVDGDIKERGENGVVVPVDVPATERTLNGVTAQPAGEVTMNSEHSAMDAAAKDVYATSTVDWDLHRSALLATTPEVETRWMSAPSSTTTIDTNSLPAAPHLFEGMNSNGGADSHDVDESALQTLVPRQLVGPDNLVVLPRVDEHRFYTQPHVNASPSHLPPQMIQQHHLPISVPFANMQHAPQQHHGSFSYVQSMHQQQPGVMMQMSSNGGRRKVRLRLQEEVRNSNNSIKRHFRSSSLFGTLRKSSKRMFGGSYSGAMQEMRDEVEAMPELYKTVDRGSLAVSWYEGTSSLELQQHVRKSVTRKLKLENSNVELDDFRVLDDSVDPPEEVVLAPYMPDGAQFLLRFSTVSAGKSGTIREIDGTMTPLSQYSGRAPVSPSAAPSPHPDKDMFSKLNANQLALLNSLKVPTERSPSARAKRDVKNDSTIEPSNADDSTHPLLRRDPIERDTAASENDDEDAEELDDDTTDGKEEMLQSDDPIESRLREITELLLSDRKKSRLRRQERQGEKRQVIFIVANYFVLFLALIAISAELQARAPLWLKTMEDELQSVKNCSENQEVLMECVSRGDFAGLIASVLLWLSRSVATKRIFLFGFDTPKKLWTVVYESLVSSICWGISYLFIRRGMNSDTRPRFVQKYWKDAVYGSLAGFNAAFLKHVLKNLIPEDVVEGALRERQLKMFGWLHSFE